MEDHFATLPPLKFPDIQTMTSFWSCGIDKLQIEPVHGLPFVAKRVHFCEATYFYCSFMISWLKETDRRILPLHDKGVLLLGCI